MAKKLNEIRRGKKIKNHPAYIYARDGNTYKFIGITHAPITQGVRNIKLLKNPNPNDSRDSYARPFSDQDKIHNFGRRLKGWKIDPADKKTLDKIKK